MLFRALTGLTLDLGPMPTLLTWVCQHRFRIRSLMTGCYSNNSRLSPSIMGKICFFILIAHDHAFAARVGPA